MKRLTLLVVLGIFLFSSTAVARWSDWSRWNTHSCYKGLDYRARVDREPSSDGRYEWDFEFRNRYRERIHFSFEITDPDVSQKRTTNRTDIKPGGTTGTGWTFIRSSSRYNVFIDKVRFGRDGLQEYSSCD